MSVLNYSPNPGNNLDLSNSTGGLDLASSQYSQGGTMAPTINNYYGGSTAGQTKLLNNAQDQLTNTTNNSGVFGLSSNQVGQLAGKGITSSLSPNSTFNTLLNNIDQFGTNFGFGAPTSATSVAANAGDLGLGNFVNAAGDSVAAGTEGATAVGSNAGLSQLFADATASTDAAGVGGAAASGIGTLSSTLGGAGIGYLAGGLISHLTGENATGSSIGGAIGGAAGAAFGGAALTSLGLELGSFAGPVGMAVGAVGGAVLGGLFGNNSPATSTGGFDGPLSSTGSVTDPLYGSKNGSTEEAHNIDNQVDTLFSDASKKLNLDFGSNVYIKGGTNTLHSGPGGSLNAAQIGYLDVMNSKTGDLTRFNFDPADLQQKQTAYIGALKQAASVAGYTNTDALNSYINSLTTDTVGTGAIRSMPNVPVNTNQGTNNATTPTVTA